MPAQKGDEAVGSPEPLQYAVAHLRRALAEDERTYELGIHVTIRGETIVLDGEVESDERRQLIETVVRETLPQLAVHNDVRVARITAPDQHETLSVTRRSRRERS